MIRKLFRNYKTEINPTKEQKQLINKTIGTCRYIYNFFIAHNKKIYQCERRFVSGYDFSKWLNNEFIPNNPEYKWIKEVSSKSIKQSIMDAEVAFRKFFKGESKFPKFKSKKNNDVKMHFVKTDAKTNIKCHRHRIKIPTLGWIRIKEKGYIPTNKIIKSGVISYHAERYYISVLIEENINVSNQTFTEGIGIDLGIKDFAICSNKNTYKNINKTNKIRKLNKNLKRAQKSLSRKYEGLIQKNKIIEGVATRQNIQKNILKVQKLHNRLYNIRTDYINKIISELVKIKPEYIVLEDLNVKGMMKNRHLSKAISNQNFSTFRNKLINKCKSNGIEVRIADRWYPSSKTCHKCGCIKSNLKLSDRTYVCECGYIEDRDFNASLNLRDVKTYKVA